jgi:fructose-specific PTS system IIA-like component
VACTIDLAFPLPLGLHARPAAALRDAACRCRAAITFANLRTGRTANAKSALALVATLTRAGDPCTLRLEGDDEQAAAEAMRVFVAGELARCDDAATAPPPSPAGGAPLPRALAGADVRLLRGIPASGGVARGRVVVAAARDVEARLAGEVAGPAAAESARLTGAIAAVGDELRAALSAATGEAQRGILAAHLAILEDPELRARAEGEIGAGLGAGRAVVAAAGHFAAILRDSGSALLAERVLDLRELAGRLVRTLSGDARGDAPVGLPEDAVWVADELGPAELIALDRRRLAAIALGRGGATSHTAILARAFGIPCVVGLGEVERTLAPGLEVIVDGERGLVAVEPPPAVRSFYAGEAAKLATLAGRAARFAATPGRTADGRRVEVAANVASLAEVAPAFAAGAEGIGLFRTELLFMERAEPPGEDEQAEVYAEAARLAGDRPVVVRTLDAGGDKAVPGLELPAEANPFFGCRAVRMYGAHEAIVAAQVRALLRAAAAGPLRVMVPMVSSVEEVRGFRAVVARLAAELAAGGLEHDPAVEIGIMVEVPSAALAIGSLAAAADFFSLGTNDLAQYVFAADRGNPRVAHLADELHPAFLRLLDTVVRDAHRADRRVSLCGELAGRAEAVPLLVGLGLDGLSVAAPRIAAVKAALAGCEEAACRALLEAALAKDTAAAVRALLRDFALSTRPAAPVAAETVRLASASRTRDEAIRELVDVLHLAGRVDDADAVEAAVWAREATYSTGVGFGVAIPHCVSPHVAATSIAVARFAAPVDWESLDGEPVQLAILVAVRADAPGDEHLRLIAGLSRRLMDDEFRASLLQASNEDEIVALLRTAGAAPEGGS